MKASIEVENIGQKFEKQWIFKNINYNFESNKSYAIVGSNGSGKSTFLTVLSGYQTPTIGNLKFKIDNNIIEQNDVYKYISIAAPYISLLEEYTLMEMLKFHFSFSKIIENQTIDSLIAFVYLENSKQKQIRNFSSGMKQRLKLGLAIFTEKPILLLDEPTVNLDAVGIQWYLEKLLPICQQKLSIICSNQTQEYAHCDVILNINDYKN